MDWILENGVGWDFFYEHCSLFTTESLRFAFENSGFRVRGVERIFGGQYLLIEASPAEGANPIAPNAGSTPFLAQRFAQNASKQRASWQQTLDSRREFGAVAIWGAGAKGVTLLNMLDSNALHISAVVDINPQKQNRHIPGTGHLCIGPAEISKFGIQSILVTNPNYLTEIRSILKATAPTCQIINLMETNT